MSYGRRVPPCNDVDSPKFRDGFTCDSEAEEEEEEEAAVSSPFVVASCGSFSITGTMQYWGYLRMVFTGRTLQ